MSSFSGDVQHSWWWDGIPSAMDKTEQDSSANEVCFMMHTAESAYLVTSLTPTPSGVYTTRCYQTRLPLFLSSEQVCPCHTFCTNEDIISLPLVIKSRTFPQVFVVVLDRYSQRDRESKALSPRQQQRLTNCNLIFRRASHQAHCLPCQLLVQPFYHLFLAPPLAPPLSCSNRLL